ncbi:MAG: hypothetical protein M5U01_14795 [Ardenticatenaceae bacterium]|nr:hypothetical protein [Ardenticatenaceae bacterium]
MIADKGPDPRLVLVYELLRGLLDESQTEGAQARSPRQVPFMPPVAPGGKMSATDLLSWWFRPASNAADPWEDYFDQPFAVPSLGETIRSPVPAPMPWRFSGELALEQTQALTPWTDWQTILNSPEEELGDQQAEAAAACLYDFIHAIGRQDVDSAMELVADDYHVLEDDREIDRLALRHHLESLLDSLRGWEFEVSLGEVPEPLHHPYGILIYTEIHVTAHHPQSGARRSIVERRLALLQQRANGEWAIAALSLVGDRG